MLKCIYFLQLPFSQKFVLEVGVPKCQYLGQISTDFDKIGLKSKGISSSKFNVINLWKTEDRQIKNSIGFPKISRFLVVGVLKRSFFGQISTNFTKVGLK